jgi:hypothetical protein
MVNDGGIRIAGITGASATVRENSVVRERWRVISINEQRRFRAEPHGQAKRRVSPADTHCVCESSPVSVGEE